MTPAEMRLSDDPRVRHRARCVIYDRVVRMGWSEERALTEPVSRSGRGRPAAQGPRGGRDGATLDEVAASLGVSRERARQIEESALGALRVALLRAINGRCGEVTPGDIMRWLDRRASDPDTVEMWSSRVGRSADDGGRGWAWVAQVPPGAYAESVQRAEREIDEGLGSIAETARAYRAVERVIEGMSL
jgi:hypothetical protein